MGVNLPSRMLSLYLNGGIWWSQNVRDEPSNYSTWLFNGFPMGFSMVFVGFSMIFHGFLVLQRFSQNATYWSSLLWSNQPLGRDPNLRKSSNRSRSREDIWLTLDGPMNPELFEDLSGISNGRWMGVFFGLV